MLQPHPYRYLTYPPIDTYESLNGLRQHGSTLTYNTFGLLLSKTDYDFGTASSRGSTLRKETWTYPTTGIVNLVASDAVTDGANTIGLTTYLYDETSGTGHAALTTTSGLPNRAAAGSQRGNLTTVNQYSDANHLVTNAGAFEDTGNVLSATGPAGVSTYTYDAPTHAFTVTAKPPTPSSGVIALPSSATYDANSGLILTAVDPNNQTTTYTS